MTDCWISSRLVLDELRSHFADINRAVSTYYEDNPNVREEALDGHLTSRIASGLPDRRISRLREDRVRSGRPPLSFRFSAREITHREREHGADLGVVAQIDVPGEMAVTKAALIQSKKLGYNGGFRETSNYPELFGSATKTLIPQAQRMLKVTPASFYLLYNPERLYIRRGIKTLGIRAMPARLIEGMEAAGRVRFSAVDALERSLTFESWIVDQFVCCGVGDSRAEVVRTALGGNQEFPIRHVIEIGISTDETNLELFARNDPDFLNP
jgi:hypothetical protein